MNRRGGPVAGSAFAPAARSVSLSINSALRERPRS